MKRLIAIAAITPLVIFGVAQAVPSPKYFVCKYVGTPGVNETLQTGQNPISVSGNAITPPVTIGAYFNDAQGRSLVVAEDTGQDEPECPAPQNPPKEEEPPVIPPVVTTPPKEETPPQTQGASTTTPSTPVAGTPQVLPETGVFEGK